MNHPVCVVIPTYNRASLLPETLDSILTQRAPASEIIVVDDGSTDNTKEVISRFGKHVRLVTVENGGDCRARNVGASLSSQPWIAFCDSDDLWREDKLEQQIGLHLEHPQVGYSFTNFRELDNKTLAQTTKFDQAPAEQAILYAKRQGYSLCERPLYREILAFQPVWPSSLIVHQDFFTEVGRWGENHGRNPSADLEFILRCVRRPPTGILHEPLLTVRKHGSNFSGDAKVRTDGEIRILKFAEEHHAVDAETNTIIQHQIHLRQVDRCYGMFQEGHFDEFLQLSTSLPWSYLDKKVRLKQAISRLPGPLANMIHGVLVRKA